MSVRAKLQGAKRLLRSRYFWASFFAVFAFDITGRAQAQPLKEARAELAKRS